MKDLRNQRDFVRVNDAIRFSPVRVIGADGENLGVIPTRRAQEIARERNLDLVEVSPQSRPPVCRICDYGKFKYEQSIRQKEQKQRQRATQLKEIRLRPSIAANDVDTKVRAILKFLEEGHKVQVKVQFKKRENAHKDLGFKVLAAIIEQLKEHAVVRNPPKLEGRDVSCLLEPVKN